MTTPEAPPAPTEPETTAPPPASDDDKPLGPAGERALQAERDARKRLEQELAPLKQLAAALTGGKPPAGKSEIELINERLAAQEKTIADQAVALLRAEVASEKKLTPEQAAELRGANREELAAHADKLIALFGRPADPETEPRRKGTVRPDPAQGARPGEKTSSRDLGKAEAAKRFGKPAAT
jgi:hypothetical protein